MDVAKGAGETEKANISFFLSIHISGGGQIPTTSVRWNKKETKRDGVQGPTIHK